VSGVPQKGASPTPLTGEKGDHEDKVESQDTVTGTDPATVTATATVTDTATATATATVTDTVAGTVPLFAATGLAGPAFVDALPAL
jgi:hypothetical protein